MATAPRSSSKPAPHGRVVGRYLMFGQIGSGGTATVHFGRLRGQGGFVRTVALKRLHAHLARDPYFVSLFLSEARLAARVSHPNVTSLLDVVCQDDGELLLVMDYVHGETLAGLLGLCRRREVPVAPRIATAIIVGALAGLHAAHEAIGEDGHPLGLVHGDVSPHNVIIGADGTPRMLDFGVARAGAACNQDRRVIGTLAYMAPERLRGTGFDRRSDVFSAGVLLWEMLAMRRLFSGCDGRTKRALAQIPPPSKYQPQIPRALDDAVLWALRSEANDRPEDSLAFSRALESAVAPASNREIADWLQLTAGARLRERAEELSRIERSSVPSLLGEDDLEDLPTTASTGLPAPGQRGELAGTPISSVSADEEPTLFDAALIARSQAFLGAGLMEGPGRAALPTPPLPRTAEPSPPPVVPRHDTASEVHSSIRLDTAGELHLETRGDLRYRTSPGSPSASPPPIADDDDMPLPPPVFERRRMVLGGLVALAGFAGALWFVGQPTSPATAANRSGPALDRQLAVAAAPAAPAAPAPPAPLPLDLPPAPAAAAPEPVREPAALAAPVAEPPATPEPTEATPPPVAARRKTAAPRPPAASETDARALRTRVLALNTNAMAAYESLEPDRALEQLRLALRLSGEAVLYSRELAALTHMNLGVVLAGGFKQRDLAVRHFREAQALVPAMAPSAESANPEIRAAFAEASRVGR